MKRIVLSFVLTLFSSIASADGCYESSILSPSPFMGNDGEIFKLADGSFWQVKYEYEYMYEYYPEVIICPSKGKLAIKGKNLNVEAISSKPSIPTKRGATSSGELIESKIDGEFNGWEGETVVKLMNGQIWQQSEYYYRYHYAFMPGVIIYKSGGAYKMKVNGIEKAVGVIQLK